MKILIVGLGSMGTRRLRLLKNNFKGIEISAVDLKLERREKVEKLFKIKTYESIDKALEIEKPEIAFISTSPLSHFKLVDYFFDKRIHTFSEINLVNYGYNKIIKNDSKDIVTFLSSTNLYRKEIKYINKIIRNYNLKVNYRYHVGQYLPDWHPWETYKDFFVNDKKTNGCKEIMGIELPWIINTFGKIKTIKLSKNKISNLDLDYPDVYNIILEHETGHIGNITIDIVSRKAIKNLEIISNDFNIFWNGTPDSLEIYNGEKKQTSNIKCYNQYEKNKNYSSKIIEDPYLEEIKEFLDKIKNRNKQVYSYKEDLYVLEIISKIEGEI